MFVNKNKMFARRAVLNRQTFSVGMRTEARKISFAAAQADILFGKRFPEAWQLLLQPVHIGEAQTVLRKKLRAVTATEGVEGYFIDSPGAQFGAKPGECPDVG